MQVTAAAAASSTLSTTETVAWNVPPGDWKLSPFVDVPIKSEQDVPRN
jgi:hypothetical protein